MLAIVGLRHRHCSTTPLSSSGLGRASLTSRGSERGGVGADRQGRVVAAQRVSDDDLASVRSRADADGGPVAVLGAAQQVVDDVDVQVQLARCSGPKVEEEQVNEEVTVPNR